MNNVFFFLPTWVSGPESLRGDLTRPLPVSPPAVAFSCVGRSPLTASNRLVSQSGKSPFGFSLLAAGKRSITEGSFFFPSENEHKKAIIAVGWIGPKCPRHVLFTCGGLFGKGEKGKKKNSRGNALVFPASLEGHAAALVWRLQGPSGDPGSCLMSFGYLNRLVYLAVIPATPAGQNRADADLWSLHLGFLAIFASFF